MTCAQAASDQGEAPVGVSRVGSAESARFGDWSMSILVRDAGRLDPGVVEGANPGRGGASASARLSGLSLTRGDLPEHETPVTA